MCAKLFTKAERLAHEEFASSLRTWCNSDCDENVQSPLDATLSWIDGISSRLLVGSKVDLLRIPRLTGLTTFEVDFLKAAIPTLTYFAKSSSSDPGCESSSLVLKKWSGVPVTSSDLSSSSPNLFLNRVKFKNVLLRLLSHPCKDKRVRRMQRFLRNCSELDSSDAESNPLTPADSSHKSPQCSPVKSKTQNPDLEPLQNRTVLNPNTSMLLKLLDQASLPPLFIEYVSPTRGLFATDHLNLKSYRRIPKYHYHNCFLKNNQADWVTSLRQL